MRYPLLLCCLPLGLFSIGCHSTARLRANSEIEAADGSQSGSASGVDTGLAGHAPPDPVRPGGPTVLFPGFDVLADGRSVITITATGPTNVTQQGSTSRIVYTLSGVSVPYKVNRLPLVTENFPTQVSRVTVEQGTGGANLVIELRETSTSTFTTSKVEGGTLLTITLPRSEKYAAIGTATHSVGGATWEESNGHSRRAENAAEHDATKAEDGTDEKRRYKRHVRQPIPYAQRHITLPYRTLAPDAGVSIFGPDKTSGGADTLSNSFDVWLSGGLHLGITDWFEVEASPMQFRLKPNSAFAMPSLGASVSFFRLAAELGFQTRFFIPVDSAKGDTAGDGSTIDPRAELMLGLPLWFHLGSWGRIETGGFVSMKFNGFAAGLYQDIPSPVAHEPGIPVKFIFQPARAFWFGASTGYDLEDFSEVSATSYIPLGFQAGITTYDVFNANADIGVRFDLPRLFSPGQTDKVQDDYQFGVYLRWYYYL